MLNKILTYSVIVVLALTLIGGTIAILVRPNDAEARGGPGATQERVSGSQRGGREDDPAQGIGNGGSQQGLGQDRAGQGRGQDAGNAGAGNGGAQGNDKYATPVSWETVTGVVMISDSDLTVDTGTGEVIVGLGQSSYQEELGFVVNVGDEVRVEGYTEDGEFKAGTVENLTTGASIVLRDAFGRPMWSGQGSQQYREATQVVGDGYGSGNDGGNGRGQGNGSVDQSITLPEPVAGEALPCPICDTVVTYDGPLTGEEVAALLLALNDEYHAWTVYEQVITDFGAVRPFASIQNAEASHISALLRLFETYDITVPENPWIGQVDGFESLDAACTAGVAAEIANGALYDTLFASTERADILEVYTVLQRASVEQHLPAFARCAD